MSQIAERNLSSIIKTHQLKTDSTASSKTGVFESNNKKTQHQSKVVQITARKTAKRIDNVYSDFNYVKSANSLHRQAIALINKPVKNYDIISERRKSHSQQLIDLNEIDDPFISVKLNIDSLNPILDLTDQQNTSLENISIRSNEYQKSVQNKLFMNIVKDYDIEPVMESPVFNKSETKLKALNDENKENQEQKEKETLNDSTEKSRIVHFSIDESIEPTDEISLKTERQSSTHRSANISFPNKSALNTPHSGIKSAVKTAFYQSANNPTVRSYFRHQVRKVIALIKIVEYAYSKANSNRKYLKKRTTDKITEMVQDALRRPYFQDQRYNFNKDYYKASRQTDCSKEVQLILTTPPDMRTYEQIKLVRMALLGIKAFQEYPINMLDKICQCAYYQKVDSKRVIIRQGHIADSFYFIITGQAMVTVMEQDKNTDEIKNRIATIIKDGACFGELAFIYSTTRTATVTSLSDMELISIDREDFFDIFMTKNKGEEPEHIKYLRDCAFIKYWPIEKLIEYPQNCHYHYYKRGQVIVSNSLNCDYIYVVKSGMCQVLKKLNDVKPRRILSARIPKIKEEFICSSYKPKVDTGLPFKRGKTANEAYRRENLPLNWSSNEILKKRPDTSKPIFLLMQLLKEGDVFGLNLLKFDETDNDYPNPEVSLVSQGAEVLMLNIEYFLRYSSEDVRDNVRSIMQVYPRTQDMQRRLQNEADWTSFKQDTLKIIFSKYKKY